MKDVNGKQETVNRINAKLIFILIVAFLIRFIALNQSLWLDEGTTARVTTQYNFSEIITKFSPFDFHPPIYYFFMKLWTSFFGTSEIALRMPSVLFSIAAGYIIYLIGVKLKNKQFGLWAAVLFLFNPLIVYYSQEARMYMMATFLVVLSFYFLLRFICHFDPPAGGEKSNLTGVFLVISLLFSFYTFYGTAFFIAAVFVYLFLKKQYKIFLLIAGFFLLTLLFYFPLLAKQFTNSHIMRSVVVNWSSILGKANLKNLVLIPIKFSFGRISLDQKNIYYVAAGIWTLLLLILTAIGATKQKKVLFFLIFPLVLGVIFSFFTPLLQYFRFLYLIPFFIILIASVVFQKVWKWYILLGFIVLSFIYLFVPSYHREDWKGLAKILPKNTPVYIIPSSADSLVYYRNDIQIRDIRNTNAAVEKSLIVIPYTSDIYSINYKDNLLKGNYSIFGKSTFRGIVVEGWRRNL